MEAGVVGSNVNKLESSVAAFVTAGDDDDAPNALPLA